MAKRPSNPAPEPEPAADTVRELPLVALRETVIFPEMIVPLQVGREKSVAALNAAVESSGPIALVTQRQAEQEDIGDPSELYQVGTLAKIAQVVQLQDGTVRAIVQGQTRIRVHGFTHTAPYLSARVEEIPDETPRGRRDPGAHAQRPGPDRAVRRERHADPARGGRRRPQHRGARAPRGHRGVQPRQVDEKRRSSSRRSTSRSASSWSATSSPADRDPRARGRSRPRSRTRWTRRSASTSCASSSRRSSRSSARTTTLQAEIDELREKIEAAGMPEEVARPARQGARPAREDAVRRPPRTASSAPTSTGSSACRGSSRPRTSSTSWRPRRSSTRTTTASRRSRSASSSTSPSAAHRQDPRPDPLLRRPSGRRQDLARQIDRPGAGPQVRPDVARRHPRRGGDPRPPPDVRRRAAGPHHPGDQAGGHQQPGVHAGRDRQGRRPTSEAIRRRRCSRCSIPSRTTRSRTTTSRCRSTSRKVMFITTANVLDTIPRALRDRMEVIHLPGYTEDEKLHIAQTYLVPQADRGARTDGRSGRVDRRRAPRDHPRVHARGRRAQPRARDRERLPQGRAQVVEGRKGKTVVDGEKLHEYLGPPRFVRRARGARTRSAWPPASSWTEVGGDVIFVEATKMAGKGNVILTGQLGRRHARVGARRAVVDPHERASDARASRRVFEKHDLHIHVPAGAIPKDGPSAGVTMATALASALTGLPVRPTWR